MTTSRRVYLDNAATSFPKPPGVGAAMAKFTTDLGASPGRGAYSESIEAEGRVQAARAALAGLLGEHDPRRIVFTLNCTDALSMAIYGIARHWRLRGEGVHMVTTSMDHNSVLRPLNDLQADGVRSTHVEADPITGLIDPDAVTDAITAGTRLVCIVHGSNVSGTVQDIAAVADRCRTAGVPMLVDAAQTAGHQALSPQAMGIDLLAVPGHKGLLGPLGTGALWLGPGMEEQVHPLRTGGTGSHSEDDVQPDMLPDRYESGSHNTVGLIGLGAALSWIEARTIDVLHADHMHVAGHMLEGLLSIDGLCVSGPLTMSHRCGVFSLHSGAVGPAEFARGLEENHGVLGRWGLHCAPRAHRTFGTLEAGGTLRLSIGHATTIEDVEQALAGVRAVHGAAMSRPAAILVP